MNHSISSYSESIPGYDFPFVSHFPQYGSMQISTRFVPTVSILSQVIPVSPLEVESKRLFLLFTFSTVAYSFLAERVSNPICTYMNIHLDQGCISTQHLSQNANMLLKLTVGERTDI